MTKEVITIDTAKATILAEAKETVTRHITSHLRRIAEQQRIIKHHEKNVAELHETIDKILAQANSGDEGLLEIANDVGRVTSNW